MNFILEGLALRLKNNQRMDEEQGEKEMCKQEFAIVLYFINICLSHVSLLSWKVGDSWLCNDL